MILRWGICLAILEATQLGASTLDVSSETSIVVHAGDTLIFELLTGSFGVNAALQDQSPFPTDVNFDLVSAPLSEAAGFAASVESADGTVSFALGDLTFGLGNLQSSGYTGAVSVLQSALHLPSLLDSAQLFSGSTVVIALLNEGPDVTLGLAPYLLRQDLFASLSGGPLSVGAITASVELESPDQPLNLKRFGRMDPSGGDSEVPEPQTLGLLFGGGALLCWLSAVVGVWFWYTWFGSVPRTYWSVRFDEPAYSGQSAFYGKDQIVFIHGDTLARYDMKLKKEIWSRHLVDKKEIEAADRKSTRGMQAVIDKANDEDPDHVPR